jgi:hypothetical protein
MQTSHARQTLPEMTVVRRQLERIGHKSVDATTIERHCSHLSTLATRLRVMGMDERDVAVHVLGIFRQYERALTETIKGAHDA